ncbi:MAG: glycosyltransferase, partial [Flavobacteriaceae bacterium]|nr:glycosyltransferase [Flavobacteriaceae bacterium]
SQFEGNLILTINYLHNHLEKNRKENFFGQILNHQHLQSTKYMSLWIEEKNKKKG